MRLVLKALFLVAIFAGSGATKASIVQIPISGIFDVLGPFSSDSSEFVQVHYFYDLLGDPMPPGGSPAGPQTSYDLIIRVMGGIGFSADLSSCASSNPGPCGSFGLGIDYSLLNKDSHTVTTLTALEQFSEVPGFFESPASQYVELFAILPDGFSVAAVPELSTWIMLLLGFSGLGFTAAYRVKAGPITSHRG